MKKKVKIFYVEKDKTYGKEGYRIEYLKENSEWKLECFFPMKDEEFVHYTLISKLNQLQNLGYEIQFYK